MAVKQPNAKGAFNTHDESIRKEEAESDSSDEEGDGATDSWLSKEVVPAFINRCKITTEDVQTALKAKILEMGKD